MARLHVGMLDRQVTIESVTRSHDAAGGATESWSTLATVSASRQQQAGREFLRGEAIASQQNVVFRIRYRSDVTAEMRVTDGSTVHDIIAVREIGRQQWLELQTVVRS